MHAELWLYIDRALEKNERAVRSIHGELLMDGKNV